MLGVMSFVAGSVLGLIHFRVYHKTLGALMSKPAESPFRFLGLGLGAFRLIFTFAAGILLIRVARLDPIALCGGLLVATVAYRAVLFYRHSAL